MSFHFNLSALAALLTALFPVSAHSQFFLTDATTLAEIRVTSQQGKAVPRGFMGLSHEWGNTMSMFGYSKTGSNLAYRQLIANLTAYSSDPMELRIGGNSTDTTGRPSGDRMKPYAELANALHARFILGVNLGSADLALTEDQVAFYLKEMPKDSIEAIEVGNEPDHYPKRKMRPEPYGTSEYFQDFDTWKHGILPLLPQGILLAGPSWSAIEIIPNSSSFLDREASSIGVLSLHFYAGSPYSNPPPDYLLKPRVATSGPVVFAPAIAAARYRHIPFRITEFNSFYGVGVHGLSDAFSAALWSIDTMFEYVNAGVDGVNWEADGGNFCSPFIFTRTTSAQMNTFTLKSATPLYYGLLFFQAATGKRARLLYVEVDTGANLKAWATVDEAGKTRLAIVNKDETAQGNVSVRIPGYSQATVIRLLAPSYTSLSGVTFGGRTLDGSADGKLLGTEKTETFHATGGTFQIPMPVTSAALVTFSK